MSMEILWLSNQLDVPTSASTIVITADCRTYHKVSMKVNLDDAHALTLRSLEDYAILRATYHRAKKRPPEARPAINRSIHKVFITAVISDLGRPWKERRRSAPSGSTINKEDSDTVDFTALLHSILGCKFCWSIKEL